MHDTKIKQSIRTGSASTSSVQNVDRRDSKMCFHCDSPMAINSNTQCTNSPTQRYDNNSYILNSLLTLKNEIKIHDVFR